ncbi:MAG TPA: cytochrome c peroxidase [Vicingaceae bacterium]
MAATNKLTLLLIIALSVLFSCSKDKDPITPTPIPPTSGGSSPTPYALTIPPIFAQTLPAPFNPPNNPLTVEGIELGRHLFYDPILSGDGTQSCATCHAPELAFTDTNQFSTGIDGLEGNRNSMPIFNAAWNFNNKFFWDGRALGLEGQAFGPVRNPIEMHNTWPNAVASLQSHPTYPSMFNTAFGTSTIDSVLVVKAIAQFERTLISANSKFDRYLLGMEALTPQEASGFNLFMDQQGGDCFHCHGSAGNPLWTDNDFHNNGLDATFTDLGLGGVTGNPADNGKFKTPSLRNLVFTAPYMHDGRFQTLDEVLDFYSTGVQISSTIDPMMEHAANGGVQLTAQEKANLKAFLLSLTDNNFVTNPTFQAP